MPDPAVFVTGTGTGVGKTVAGCAIAAAWAAAGRAPRVMKPAESGCERRAGVLHPADAWALREAAGDPRPLEAICPHRYALPLAPAHAAEEEGAPPDLDAVAEAVGRLRAAPGPLLVEGAGGLMVPLSGRALVADLAGRLGLPVVVAAPLGLGTLSPTLLTVEALRARGLAVAGVVLCDLDGEAGPAGRRNPRAVGELCGAPLLGVVPHLPGIGGALAAGARPGTAGARRLCAAAAGLDLAALEEAPA